MIRALEKIFGWVSPDISLDLGSYTTTALVGGQGKVFSEPTYVAFERSHNRVVAVGAMAKALAGRTLSNIEVVRPVREGVLADFDSAEIFIKHTLRLINAKGVAAPRIVVGVPVGASDVECRAAAEAARAAGARTVYIIPQLLASAVGAGAAVMDPRGQMVLNIGGETVQVGVISMGNIIVSEGVRWGSGRFDECLVAFFRNKFNHLVDAANAEELKIKIGSTPGEDGAAKADICGLDLNSGLPRAISVDSDAIAEQLAGPLDEIAQMLKRVLEMTPPELAEDIMENGCLLCGAGSLLRGMDRYLSRASGIYCYRAEDPAISSVVGAEQVLRDPLLLRSMLSRSLLSL